MPDKDIEQLSVSLFIKHVDRAIDAAKSISHWGDGRGGYLKAIFQERLDAAMCRACNSSKGTR